MLRQQLSLLFILKSNLFTLVRLFNSLLLFFLVIMLCSPDLRMYSSYALFLLPSCLYLLLSESGKILSRLIPLNHIQLYHYLELSLFFILVVILISYSGGATSQLKVIMLLPVLFYSLAFGSRWGYVVSLTYIIIVNAPFFFGGGTAEVAIHKDFLLPLLFFLASWIGGKEIGDKNIGERVFNGITPLKLPCVRRKLKQMLAESAGKNYRIALVLIGLRKFNEFTEKWGPCARDVVLKSMVKTLEDYLDKNVSAFYCGDGKFAVIIWAGGICQVIAKSKRLHRALAERLEGVVEEEWRTPVAAGVSLFPDHGRSWQSLLQAAEIALANSQSCLGGRVSLYYPVIERLERGKNRKLMEAVEATIAQLREKNGFVYRHSERVLVFTQLSCRGLALSSSKCMYIECAAILHDIGKMLFKNNIAEKEIMEKEHPLCGVEMVWSNRAMYNVVPSILYHHEKYDGTGYPYGLKGSEIPLGARIIAVADFFDYLTAERLSNGQQVVHEAIDKLQQQKGKLFDPLVVDAFSKQIGYYKEILHVLEYPKYFDNIVPAGYKNGYFQLGGHYAEFYCGEIHFSVKAVSCIAAGIANAEMCLYLTDDNKAHYITKHVYEMVHTGGVRQGLDRLGRMKRIMLIPNLTKMDKRTARFEFEIKKIFRTWIKEAEKEDCSSVRVVIDYSTLNIGGMELLLWEKTIARCIKDAEIVVICYYDIKAIKGGDLYAIEGLHDSPLII